MQIMPRTYTEIKKKNPYLRDIRSPKWNIAAALYYNRKLYKRWNKNLSKEERLNFTFASYNAGYTGVKRAFNKAKSKHGEVDFWEEAAVYAPKETRNYVKKIRRLMSKE